MIHVRSLPWQSWREWRLLKADLWSNERERIERGLSKIHDWSCVCVLPTEVEITAALFKAESAWEAQSPDSAVLEALYSVPLIRLTAALRDQEDAVTLRPGAELPLSVGLARNEYVHNEKPTLEHLRAAAKAASDFIKTHYWDYVEESLPSTKQLLEAVQGWFALHQKLTGQRITDAGMLEEFAKYAQPIYLSLDGDQLQSLLLDSVSPPVDPSDDKSFQSGLLEFCEGYDANWLIYLAESWLERALMQFPDSQESSNRTVKSNPNLLKWGRIIAATLSDHKCHLHASELHRILQKIMQLLQHLIVHRRHLQGSVVHSFWEVTRQLFEYMQQQLSNTESKKKLSTLYRHMGQQFKSQTNTSATQPAREAHQEQRYGRFVKLQNWEFCAFGDLPYDYKPRSRTETTDLQG